MTPRKVSRRFRNKQSWGRSRPFLLALESRIAPAVFTVDDLGDDPMNPPPNSLRGAVNASQPGDRIIIIKMGMITMAATLDVPDSVEIDPFGASENIIDFSHMLTPGPGFHVCAKSARALV